MPAPPRQTFEFHSAEVSTLEQAAGLSAGGSVDHHMVWTGQPLKACREVRRLADRCLLAERPPRQ